MGFEIVQKKVVLVFFFKWFPIYSSPDLHPKRSRWPDFCDRGVNIHAKNAGKKKAFFGAASLY